MLFTFHGTGDRGSEKKHVNKDDPQMFKLV